MFNAICGWMGWMGWDWMVIIGHRYSKSTFGANNFTLDSWLYHLYIFTQMNKYKGFFCF